MKGRLANRDYRQATDGVDARLDQVRQENVRKEVDRCGGVPQLVEQIQNPRLGGHRQRNVNPVDVLLAHEVGHVFQPAPHRQLERFAQTLRGAIVKERGHPGVFERISPQRASQRAAEIVGANDDCPMVLTDCPHAGEQ